MRSITYFASLFASFFTSVRFISFSTAYLLILCSLSAAFTVQATPFEDQATQREPVIMVKEYTYRASENDSKVSARRAALEQLQKAAIEEVGVHIQSSVVNHESVIQGKLKQEMQLNFKTFSQALTKTKILDEKWNGETFYIKAEIEVDPNGINAVMNSLGGGKTEVDICKENEEKLKALYKLHANLKRNQNIADIAMSSKFDYQCNKWQYTVLSVLGRSPEYPAEGYRSFIFKQLNLAQGYDIAPFAEGIFLYVKNHTGDLTKTEWNVVFKAMQRTPVVNLSRVIRAILILDEDKYKDEINEIIQLASDEKIGTPAVNKEDVIQITLKLLSTSKNKQSAATFYLKYADELVDMNTLAPIVTAIFGWADMHYHAEESNANTPEYIELADRAVNHYFNKVKIKNLKENPRRALYKIMQPLTQTHWNKESDSSKYNTNSYITSLMQRYPDKFVQLIDSYPINEHTKNEVLINNDLPSPNLCTPEKCIKQVFNRKLSTSEQNHYLKYLVLYGSKSKVAEKDVVKLLDRAQVLSPNVHRTSRKDLLINILMNINTKSTKAIDLLIKSLTDFDHRIPDTAISALANISTPAFERIKVKYQESESLTQHRMIEAIGQMSPTQNMLTFLQSIPEPNKHNQHLKFAIEDAIEMLEMGMLELDQ